MSVVLASLDDADRRDLLAAIDNELVSTSGIFRALRARGHTVGESSIARHRRGGCKCR